MRQLCGLVLAFLLAIVLTTPSDAAARRHVTRSHAYDGLWSVSILTHSGPCDASYRYPARIVGGRIVQADPNFNYQISGAVVSSGAIAVTVNQGGHSATGYGRLRGVSGGGRWSAGGGQCTGVWKAMRRAAN